MTEVKKEDVVDNEQFNTEVTPEASIDQSNLEGKIRISEDVIAQLATKALNSVEGVAPANPGLMANLRLGRKTINGVRISISDGEKPEISVDAYITVKYGLRIPDVCWDVQEAVKEQIERFTGYEIKGVNIYVQGITFAEKKAPDVQEADEINYPTFGGEL
jgi:uncharacterized alkaline shock family protein YloU